MVVRYEKMPLHEESERAPPGVCELSVQAATSDAFDIGPDLQSAIRDYVETSFDVKAFEYEQPGESNRVVVFTGTDRLDIASLRDISEVYGQVSGFTQGNIPPEMSVVPTAERGSEEDFFAWLEFKLELELPHEEVEFRVHQELGDVEFTPKNPVGENMEAIVYRDRNVANNSVRNILNRASTITDSLPVDYIRIVCEGKR